MERVGFSKIKWATPTGNCSPILAFRICKYSETARSICEISYGTKKKKYR